ncbi:TetR/AcrR family transcriptional regulator [Mycobacterium sp. PS03-16]|uniref:TetR/AcrR family transcriptional regulator n=1 Tax=Mycobacterium sp. PS03-16 TaxID=2559611 RepID=UPI0010738F16|nr:TetR/AcrR family transcriptional regulator [Mycobacterium sp. PS03-16]TFV56949.1 TetR/AcrR family transcriptional regulator [Mycobacterium sp. PS03-16]
MVSAEPGSRFAGIRRSAAQTRVLDAALALIAEHGVSGTSLQMIADRIGVTKAAVYHQFKTKDDIVIALTERELGGLEGALEAAEAAPDHLSGRDMLLSRVVDLAVERRRMVSVLQFDPVIVRVLAEHPPFGRFIDRLYATMLGEETGARARVHAAMLSGVISVAVMHPLVSDIDDDTLREELRRTMRRIVDLPE